MTSKRIPQRPVRVPANTYFFWPFNLSVGGATLRYSTAQLVTKLEGGKKTTYVFFAVPSVVPEFVFDSKDTEEVVAQHGTIVHQSDGIYVHDLDPGKNTVVQVTGRDHRSSQIVLLAASEAEHLWKLDLHGSEYLLLSTANIYSTDGLITLHSTDREAMQFSLYPAAKVETSLEDKNGLSGKPDGIWTKYAIEIPAAHVQYTWTKVRDAGTAHPMKMGVRFDWRKQSVAETPAESAFQDASRWELRLPRQKLAGVSEIYLHMDYAGDIGRTRLADKLLDDNFFNGSAWEIGLTRFLPEIAGQPVQIEVLPLKGAIPRSIWTGKPGRGYRAASPSRASRT